MEFKSLNMVNAQVHKEALNNMKAREPSQVEGSA